MYVLKGRENCTVPGGLDAEEVLDLLVGLVEGVDEGVDAGAVGAVGHHGGGAGQGGVGGVGGGVLVEAEVPENEKPFIEAVIVNTY